MDTNKVTLHPEEALQHLDVISSRIKGGDERFDEQRKQAVALSKEAITHCMIGTDVDTISCDEHAHYKCPNCGMILFTEWKTRPAGFIGAKTSFCKECGKKLNWDKVNKQDESL